MNTDWTEVEVIELFVDSATHLGFGMCGSKSTGVIVRYITPGGAAELDGRLRLGDHIVCIRDYNVRGYGPDQVATVLRQTITTCLSESMLTSSVILANSPPLDETSTIATTSTATTANTTITTMGNTLSPTFSNASPTNTIFKSDKSSSSPSRIHPCYHLESGETLKSTDHILINPSILIRLIVARPANGDPMELSEIHLKQQSLCQQHQVLGMLT
ncbi:unnamed protein product [Trichobilharzia regenti]|nr:unnamed protein product [Trichobilharzia regenti]